MRFGRAGVQLSARGIRLGLSLARRRLRECSANARRGNAARDGEQGGLYAPRSSRVVRKRAGWPRAGFHRVARAGGCFNAPLTLAMSLSGDARSSAGMDGQEHHAGECDERNVAPIPRAGGDGWRVGDVFTAGSNSIAGPSLSDKSTRAAPAIPFGWTRSSSRPRSPGDPGARCSVRLERRRVSGRNTVLYRRRHLGGAAWVFHTSVRPRAQQGPPLAKSMQENPAGKSCEELPGDCFGYSVALSADGNTALIGAPRNRRGRGRRTGVSPAGLHVGAAGQEANGPAKKSRGEAASVVTWLSRGRR